MSITRVQGNGSTIGHGTGTASGSTNWIPVTLNSIPQTGNVLIASVGVFSYDPNDFAVSSITQSGVTWTKQKANSFDYNSFFCDTEIWAGVVGSNASTSITVNLACSGGWEVSYFSVADICEYSGIASSSFLDQTALNSSTSATDTADTGTTAVTTQANELWIGAITSSSGSQSAQTNGFTLLDGAQISGNGSLAYLEKIVNSTGTGDCSTTTSTGAAWVGCIATFKAAASTYTLTIPASTGGTTSPTTGTYTINAGTYQSVSATASGGYSFDYWMLDNTNVGNANPYSVQMNSNHTLEAVFVSSSQYITSIAQGAPFTVSSGALSLNVSSPLQVSNSSLSAPQANGSTNGYLASSDWNTFNNKQNALTTGNLNGTANQVNISGGTGAIIGSGVTLSLPQNIHAGASPTFAGLTTTGAVYNKGYYDLIDTNGSTWINALLIANTAPNTDFHFIPNHGTQSGGTSNVYFGYASDWASYNWMYELTPIMTLNSSGALTLAGNMTVQGNATVTGRLFVNAIPNTTGGITFTAYNGSNQYSTYLNAVSAGLMDPTKPVLQSRYGMSVGGDISAYGMLGSASDPAKGTGGGAILMGHGFTAPTAEPQFTLTDSISQPLGSTTATATLVISNGVITGVNVTNTGNNYTFADVTVNTNTGSGARLAPVIANGEITSINVYSGGSGYSTSDTVIITNNPHNTLYLTQRTTTGTSPANLNLGDLTAQGNVTLTSGSMTINGNQEIHWNTSASSDWTNIGGLNFNNSYNGLGMEFKCAAHNFGTGILYPVIQILYVNNGTFTTVHEFDMNGDYHYAGSLIHGFDSMDDFAALRAIKTKTDKSGTPVYDHDTLKFLQDEKGLFSLGACIGWELSIQQKFLNEIDSLKSEIADVQSQLNALKANNQKGTVD